MSCSNPKDEYETLVKSISEQETVISQSFDYEFKISTSQSVVSSIDAFMKKQPDGEFNKLADSLRTIWVEKVSESIYAKQQAYQNFKDEIANSIRASILKLHPASTVKELKSTNLHVKIEGENLIGEGTFQSKLKGPLLTTTIYKIKTEVAATKSLKTNQTSITEMKSEE